MYEKFGPCAAIVVFILVVLAIVAFIGIAVINANPPQWPLRKCVNQGKKDLCNELEVVALHSTAIKSPLVFGRALLPSNKQVDFPFWWERRSAFVKP